MSERERERRGRISSKKCPEGGLDSDPSVDHAVEPERKAKRKKEEQEERKGDPLLLRSPWIALALAPVREKGEIGECQADSPCEAPPRLTTGKDSSG